MDAGDADRVDLPEARAPGDQFVAQRGIADADFRPGIDHRVEPEAVGVHFGQDQLPALALGRDHDVVRPKLDLGRSRILDLDQMFLEIHHQPLLDERVDADEPVAAQIEFAERRKLEVLHGGRPQRQLGDLHPIDHVTRCHAVDDRRSAERQLQIMRHAQAHR